jgi:hypothetical protein
MGPDTYDGQWGWRSNDAYPPEFMQEKHNHYLNDELDAVLPSSVYSILTPPPAYALMVAPQKLMATPIMKVGGFQPMTANGADVPIMPIPLDLCKRTNTIVISAMSSMQSFPLLVTQSWPLPLAYAPMMAPQKLMATPIMEVGGFQIQEGLDAAAAATTGLAPELPTNIPCVWNLPFFKAEDAQYFARILKEEDEAQLSVDEMKECKIMRLLLKIKNGMPPVHKTVLRQITDKAQEFGAGPLFDKILPLLMERTLEDQERHLLVICLSKPLTVYCTSLMMSSVHTCNTTARAFSVNCLSAGHTIFTSLPKGLAKAISFIIPLMDPEYTSY